MIESSNDNLSITVQYSLLSFTYSAGITMQERAALKSEADAHDGDRSGLLLSRSFLSLL